MALQLADTVCIPCRKESAYMHAEDISSTFVHVHGRHRPRCMLADLAMQVADIGRPRFPHQLFLFRVSPRTRVMREDPICLTHAYLYVDIGLDNIE
jgi:hypothetical protein